MTPLYYVVEDANGKIYYKGLSKDCKNWIISYGYDERGYDIVPVYGILG